MSKAEAINLLRSRLKDIEKSRSSLQFQEAHTINTLISKIEFFINENKNMANLDHLILAIDLDKPELGYPIVNALIEMGVQYDKTDLEYISCNSQEAKATLNYLTELSKVKPVDKKANQVEEKKSTYYQLISTLRSYFVGEEKKEIQEFSGQTMYASVKHELEQREIDAQRWELAKAEKRAEESNVSYVSRYRN